MDELKEIPGFPDYYVNKSGEVFSRKRTVFGGEKIIHQRKCRVDNRGYRSLILYGADGKRVKMNVSRIVLLTFVGNPPAKNYFACHGSGGRLDDSIDNLSWKTPSDNNGEDKRRDGTALIGEKNHKSKLTESDVKRIIGLSKVNVSTAALAKHYKVSHTAIRLILIGKNWSHLQKESISGNAGEEVR